MNALATSLWTNSVLSTPCRDVSLTLKYPPRFGRGVNMRGLVIQLLLLPPLTRWDSDETLP
nr:MAG TPA: hypothetical protein [Caudoviricetes sp.]